MTFTYDDNTVSDLHKEAYGFRPSSEFYDWWFSATPAEKQETWDSLMETADAEVAREQALEELAIKDFEVQVAETIKLGARDRATALRWIMDASEANGDWEYLCFLTGLPYGYFKKAA